MKKQNVRTLSFIVSTFTYLLVGAAIFDALESQTEEQIKNRLETNETHYKRVYNITNDEYKSLVEVFDKYHPYKSSYPQWKFTGAFYFCLTVITTIGYGHSTPQTIPGKMFCMVYAIVGIPLCLVMFQAVGERLNYFTSFCIQFIKKTIRLKNREVNQTELVCVGGALAMFVITGGAAMFTHYEGWSYFNSIYYCVVTLTTIGFGDYVALQGPKGSSNNTTNNTGYVILSFTFILFGLTVVASSMNLLVLKFLTMNTDDERREEFTREAQRNQSLRFSSADLLNVVNGNVICTFEPADLEDLRRENSFSMCCSSKSSFINMFRNRFSRVPKIVSDFTNQNNHKYYSNNDTSVLNSKNTNGNGENNCLLKGTCFASGSEPNQTSSALASSTVQKSPSNNKCFRFLRRQKPHYTVRRAPGQIAHLLPLQRLDSIVLNTKIKATQSGIETISESHSDSNNMKNIGITNQTEAISLTINTNNDDNQAFTEFEPSTQTQMLTINSKQTEKSNAEPLINAKLSDDDQSSLNDVDIDVKIKNNNLNKNNEFDEFDFKEPDLLYI